MNYPPPKPEVILTNFFAEPTVLLVPITSRVYLALTNELNVAQKEKNIDEWLILLKNTIVDEKSISN